MRPHRHHNRLQKVSIAERRLCFDTPAPGAFPLENTVADIGTWVRARALDIGNLRTEVITGLRRAFGENPLDVQLNQLRASVNFLRTAPPFLSTIIQQRIVSQNLPRENIVELTQHDKWLQAFSRVNLTAVAPAAITLGVGETATDADTLLSNQSPVDRERIYRDYTNSFFDANVALHHTALSGNRMEETAANPNRSTILKAMRLMVGEELPGSGANSAERNMAREALRRRYFVTENEAAVGPGGEFNTIPAARARQDVLSRDFLQALMATGGLHTTVDQLENRVPTGYFRGALKLGIVTNADLLAMNAPGGVIEKLQKEETETVAKAVERLTKLSGLTTIQARALEQTFMGRLRQMPILMQVLLGFGLWRGVKAMPGLFGGAGAVAFGMYLFGGVDRPMDSFGRLATSVFGFGMSMVPDSMRQGGAPMTVAAVRRNAEVVSRFLRQQSGTDAVATGPVALLGRFKLSDLMAFFNPTAEAGSQFRFDDPGFKALARAYLASANPPLNENAIQRIFDASTPEGPANRAAFEEAMGGLCFVIASRNPANVNEAHIIQRALERMPEGQRRCSQLPTRFHDPITNTDCNPQAMYLRMVNAGYSIGAGMSEAMGDYIFSVMGVATEQQEGQEKQSQEAEKKLRSAAEALQKNIADYTGLPGARFSAVIGESNVRMAIHIPGPGGTAIRPIDFTTLAEFANLSTAENAVNTWRTRVLAQITTEMQAITPPELYTIEAQPGDTVRWTQTRLDNNTVPVPGGVAPPPPNDPHFFRATTPFIQFVNTPVTGANGLRAKYRTWFMRSSADRMLQPNPLV